MKILITLSAMLLLSSCGVKGPLYQPTAKLIQPLPVNTSVEQPVEEQEK